MTTKDIYLHTSFMINRYKGYREDKEYLKLSNNILEKTFKATLNEEDDSLYIE